jgi:hypothetical protein
VGIAIPIHHLLKRTFPGIPENVSKVDCRFGNDNYSSMT